MFMFKEKTQRNYEEMLSRALSVIYMIAPEEMAVEELDELVLKSLKVKKRDLRAIGWFLED